MADPSARRPMRLTSTNAPIALGLWARPVSNAWASSNRSSISRAGSKPFLPGENPNPLRTDGSKRSLRSHEPRRKTFCDRRRKGGFYFTLDVGRMALPQRCGSESRTADGPGKHGARPFASVSYAPDSRGNYLRFIGPRRTVDWPRAPHSWSGGNAADSQGRGSRHL